MWLWLGQVSAHRLPVIADHSPSLPCISRTVVPDFSFARHIAYNVHPRSDPHACAFLWSSTPCLLVCRHSACLGGRLGVHRGIDLLSPSESPVTPHPVVPLAFFRLRQDQRHCKPPALPLSGSGRAPEAHVGCVLHQQGGCPVTGCECAHLRPLPTPHIAAHSLAPALPLFKRRRVFSLACGTL